MKNKALWLVAASICLFQTAFAQVSQVPAVPQDTVPAVNARNYTLGPGDVVEGKVMGESDFNFVTTVDEDGNFQVPFTDRPVQAMCKTERELKAEVTKLVSKYIRNPQVSFNVTRDGRRSRPPVTIYGEVKQQQKVEMYREARLLELLSGAGGVTDDAGGMIQIFRTRPPMCAEPTEDVAWKSESSDSLDVPSRFYSLSSVRAGQESANPVIIPGDIIVVQKAAPVYFTGEVRQPTGVLLKEGGLSLTQGIAMIGGVNPQAKTKDIRISRLKSGSKERETINVNYDSIKKGLQKDVMLEPYDIIEVDKTKKSIGQLVLETVVGAARTGVQGFPGLLQQRILY